MKFLLSFLLITILILWLIRVLARIFLPYLFQKMVTKVQNQAQQRYQQQGPSYNNAPRPDGRVRVEYMPPKEKSKGDNAGDFVEYEEVK